MWMRWKEFSSFSFQLWCTNHYIITLLLHSQHLLVFFGSNAGSNFWCNDYYYQHTPEHLGIPMASGQQPLPASV